MSVVVSGVYEKARGCLHLIFRVMIVLTASQAAADDGPAIRIGNYEVGRGLPLGDTGVTIGGYATGRYDDVRGAPPRLTADHLSLMLWWEGAGRWKFFSEADLEESISTRRRSSDDERFLALERFYVDYAATDSVNIRVGKYLTPIGRWNQIHADPLVWTTSRPLVTHAVFPGTTTGGMVQGTVSLGNREMDYAVFLSAGTELRRKPAEDPFAEARGLRLNLPATNALQVGLSLADFEQEAARGRRKRLVGADFMWARQRWEITGEGAYRSSDEGAAFTAKGGFVQVVAPLTGRLYAVGRVEALRTEGADRTSRSWVAGLNYRYNRALSLKAEVVRGRYLQDGMPEGFLASLSVLF